jgi:uncharacterized protein YndB with AHSA1/START domain
MKGAESGRVTSVANLEERCVIASVVIGASPERVFRALASEEIVNWWVRPGVFDTRQWSGDVRAGGRWRASGMVRGEPYALEGEYLEVDPPRKLVHTWHFAGAPGEPTIVEYFLQAVDAGTRLTIRHFGFATHDSSANTSIGWETSLQQLLQILGASYRPDGIAIID